MTEICLNLLSLKGPFEEIMKVFEISIIEFIVKHHNPCLPYHNAIRLLLSAYGCDNKTKQNRGTWRCSVKKDIFKNLEKFSKNRLSELLLKNLCWRFMKKRLQHWLFSVKFAKFLRAAILQNTCRPLLFYSELMIS